jgi:hypothetical protein
MELQKPMLLLFSFENQLVKADKSPLLADYFAANDSLFSYIITE